MKVEKRSFIPNPEDHLVNGGRNIISLEGSARAFVSGNHDILLDAARVAAHLDITRYFVNEGQKLGLSRTEVDRAAVRSWEEARKALIGII